MESPHPPAADLPDPGAAAEPTPADVALVEELLRSVSTALRNYRLYAGQPAMLDRFLSTTRKKVAEAWEVLPLVRLEIDEHSLRWENRVVYPTAGESGDLAFSFFKDGIRGLTLLPGFEDDVEAFLGVLARAPQLREEEDDLVTLLWQADLPSLRYDYVELSGEAAEVSIGALGAEPAPPEEVRGAVRAEAAEPAPAGLTPDDFRETLYFLDDAEMRRLAEEVRREAERDLWGDVISALFDRLEDGSVERQQRILQVLGELLAYALGNAQFERASGFLRELAELAARDGLLSPEVVRDVRAIFEQLARGETIRQLAMTLEENPDALRSRALPELLGFFPASALAPLMRAVAAVSRPDVRRTFEQAIERLAVAHREEVARLLADDDPAVAVEAVRWVGRLELGAAVPELMRLLRRPETPLRLAAIDALQSLRAAAAGRALQELIEDPDREVRVAAVKAVGALHYAAARPAVEAAVASKRLRAADRSEKIAFFEAFGRLAGSEGVAYLDRTLNGKSWLGKGETPEIRACAALALGQVRHPSARTALASAANDADPVVRSAVARALREEES